VAVQLLFLVLLVHQPIDAVLTDAPVVDALDQRENVEAVSVQDHVAGFLVVDFGEQLAVLLDEGLDVGVVDADQSVHFLVLGVLVLHLVQFVVGVRDDLLQGSVLDAQTEHQFVLRHFESCGKGDDLVFAVQVHHAVVDDVDSVFENEVVDFLVRLVSEAHFEVFVDVAVAVGDSAWGHDRN